MFKYLSEILGKFTEGQRITALLIVLFGAIIITLGPSLIKDTNCKEVYTELEKQRGEILRLNSEIVQVQSSCTNERISREREILKILNVIEKDIIRIQRESKSISENIHYLILESDSDDFPQQRIPASIPSSPNFDFVMENLHSLQKICGEK
jgi:hypothetical protein